MKSVALVTDNCEVEILILPVVAVAGKVAVICVVLFTIKLADTPPKVTSATTFLMPLIKRNRTVTISWK